MMDNNMLIGSINAYLAFDAHQWSEDNFRGAQTTLRQAKDALEAAEAELTRRDAVIETAEPRDLGYGVRWCKVCETAQPLYVMGYMVEHRKADRSVCGGSHWAGGPLPDPAVSARNLETAAAREAHKRYDGDQILSEVTGEMESFDDWGYSEAERRAFVAGALWAGEKTWTHQS